MTFNTQSLSAFPPFQELPPKIREVLYKLVEEGRFNGIGGFKRPPNMWILFRSDVFASTNGQNISQSELTTKCKAAWDEATPEQRSQLKQRADAKSAELLKLFPAYQYRPMSKEEKGRWSRMTSALRKNFWLAAVVRIVERIADPNGVWEGPLTLTQWAQTCENRGEHPDTRTLEEGTGATVGGPVGAPSDGPGFYGARQAQSTGPSVRVANTTEKPATRGCGTDSPQPGSASLPARGFHPYQHSGNRSFGLQTSAQAPVHRRSARLNPPPEWLRSFLVPLGDPGDGKKRRRLVLCKFQELNRKIWVEEEVDDDLPKHLFDLLSHGGPAGTSTKDLIVRNYANPLIPQALGEDKNPYIPTIRSISEYCQYIKAYNASLESRTPFVWVDKSMLTSNVLPSSNTNQATYSSSVATPNQVIGDDPTSRHSVLTSGRAPAPAPLPTPTLAPTPAPAPAPVALGRTFTDEQFESMMAELDRPIGTNGQIATDDLQLLSQGATHASDQMYGVDAGLFGVTDSHQPPSPMALDIPPQSFDPSAQGTQNVYQQGEMVEDGPDTASFQAHWDMWVNSMAVE